MASINICLKLLHICFGSPDVTTAKFSLGSALAQQKLKFKVISQVKNIKYINLAKSQICKKYRVKTDCKGHFDVNIPAYTNQVKLYITIYTDPKITLQQEYYNNGDNNLYQGYDGNGNNLYHPSWGMFQNTLLRKCPPNYADGKHEMAWRAPHNEPNPNPRYISNVICKNSYSDGYQPNSKRLNNLCWIWGQFLDHELNLTTDAEPAQYANITTPSDDKYPNMQIIFKRSIYRNNHEGVREQLNMISSYIDGSVVYGDNSVRAYALRSLDGSGKLKTITGQNGEILANYNVDNLPNAGLPGQKYDQLFLFGDIRGNENVNLIAIQTLFMREHNRLCDKIVANKPDLKGMDEVIYQRARKLVKAIIQHITYEEFLPALLGSNSVSCYRKYDPNNKPDIAIEFSTVGFRVGHSMLPDVLNIDNTKLPLRDAFFKPEYVYQNGIDVILKGASQQVMKEINNEVVDDIRDFLFGSPGNGHLLDLASLNIQRGRDHGIGGYNDVRQAYNLASKSKFSDITSNSELAIKLSTIYVSPDYIDPWVGALCEDYYRNAAVGELIYHILVEQFTRLRDGDRFWYLNDKNITISDLEIICYSGLAEVINRNTNCQISNDNIFKI